MTTLDPRTSYAAATAWVTSLLEAVDPDQLDNATPCSEFDVLALSGHLIGTAGRSIAIAAGTDIYAVSVADREHDPAGYSARIATAIELWSADGALDKAVTVPWGTVSGREALWAYTNETLVHGWDLAVATGRDPEAPEGLAQAALVVAQKFVPAEIRGSEDVPFGAVVVPRPDAGPTEMLANWSGRVSEPWVHVVTS